MSDRDKTIWVHHAHGLRIVADFQISEGQAVRCDGEVHRSRAGDVVLRKVSAKRLPIPTRGEWNVRNSGGISVALGHYGTLLHSYCGSAALIPPDVVDVENAEILVSRGKSISTTRFNHTILHAFIPQILALRDEVVLHSTSVIIDGRCYLFAGDSGMGKSTLAAGFARLGHTIFSEDIARLEFAHQRRPVAFPSYPGVRLRGNSFLLPADLRTNEVGRFGLPKFRVNAETSIAQELPTPVHAIFFLRLGTTLRPKIVRLSPMQAIKPYLKASFLLAFPKATRARIAFAQTVKLASAIPAFSLSYKRSAPHFGELLETLVESAKRV